VIPERTDDREAAPAPPPPEETGWGFDEGEEIAPRLSAIKLLGGDLRYEAYLAWDEHLRSLVVAKLVRPAWLGDPLTIEGLAHEIAMLDRLNHPGLVRRFGGAAEGSRPHVVLEHLEGPRLSSLLRRYGSLPPHQLIPLGLQLCAVAHYMAEEGVAHLDIKPSNIVMGGPPRLIDLSVALTHEQCARTRSAVGTDAYMSPEQARLDGLPLGPPADVFGIGVTLYRAATGEPPFSPGDPNSGVPERRWPQLVEEPAQLLRERAPAEFAEPVLAALSRDPADRPTAEQLAAELELILVALPRPRISMLKPHRNR
jgi:eukaryotic-like serine/threonine-protein kinase